MNRIPMFDYLVQYHKIESDILAAVSRVLNSGRLVLGNEVRAFEGAFVDFLEGEVQRSASTAVPMRWLLH